MGNNNNNKKTQQAARKTQQNANKTQQNTKELKTKKRGKTEMFLIAFASVALVAIIVSIFAGVSMSSNKSRRVDFLNDNLSKYVSISKSAYDGITVEITGVNKVTERDIENAILQALCKNKSSEPLYDGIYMKNQTLTAGDVVYLYYRGYTLNDKGEKNFFDGGCNFASDIAELELGSGGFIPGFELGIVGKNAKDYSSFTRVDSVGAIGENDKIFISYGRELNDGTVVSTACALVDLSLGKAAIDEKFGTLFYSSVVGKQYGSVADFKVETDNGGETFTDVKIYKTTGAGDLIQLTYSAYFFDGAVVSSKTAIIDLSDPNLDKTWGEGFREYFEKGAPIGTKALNEAGKSATLNTKAAEDEINSFYDMTVSYVYDIGDNPLTVEAYFPSNYGEATLAGKTAYFDVYIRNAQIYEAPEYNDEFITETLKLTAEDLDEYSYVGDSLTDRYTEKLKAELEETYQESINTAVENKLWEIFLEEANVKSLPTNDVRDYYDGYYSEIESQFASYQAYYESFDAFAREYLGLSSNADWQATITKNAESSVTQKLVFYYIIREMNYILPDDEMKAECTKRADEYFETYLTNAGCTRDKYKTDAEYDKAVVDHRKKYDTYYNEDYFREILVYEYGFDKLRENVTVVIK